MLQSEELEEGNCQSLADGTSGPYYAMECHVPYYYYCYKRDSKIRKCLSKWCSLIAFCFNETSDWRKLCYKKFFIGFDGPILTSPLLQKMLMSRT